LSTPHAKPGSLAGTLRKIKIVYYNSKEQSSRRQMGIY
jgi:hypothetical protein